MKAVIFDLDGTLIHSLPGLTYAVNSVLENHTFPKRTEDEVRRFIGNGMKKLVERSLPEKVSLESLDEYFLEMKETYRRCWDRGMYLYPGIKECLWFLSEGSIPWGVNTNKEEDSARQILNRFLPEYSHIPLAGRVKYRPEKPDPQGALEIVQSWNIAPGETLYIGDSQVDMDTAKNGGFVKAAVTWGFRDPQDLKQKNPAFLFQDPKEISRIFEI